MITAVMLNKTLSSGTSLMQLVVMSDHYEEIKNMILHTHDAGVTLLASEKGYTKESSKNCFINFTLSINYQLLKK